MKIYTKKGDRGSTSLVDGTQVDKDNLRIETYGTVDELNSHVGLLNSHIAELEAFKSESLDLSEIQICLFHLGSQLACANKEMAQKLPNLSQEHINFLEERIDQYDGELPALKNFILPGGHIASSQAHICRTVARRAERHCVSLHSREAFDYPAIAYLNRLSDYFFMLARIFNHRQNITSPEWKP